MKVFSVLSISSKELGREVKVYISLPKNYKESKDSYPVLYMHDGQVLFNEYEESTVEGWGIMERFMDNHNSPEVILVGIESCETRNNELIPVKVISKKSGRSFGGDADVYMDFIVNQLKPLINKEYRTLATKEDTGILGVSLGGVCVIYAATNYQEHFSMFAGMSNAFPPVRKELVKMIEDTNLSGVKKMYLDVGTEETKSEQGKLAYIESNKEVYAALKEKLDSKRLKFEIFKDAGHEEKYWNMRFPEVVSFLFDK